VSGRRELVLTATGLSDGIVLANGWNKVSVVFGDSTTGTITPKRTRLVADQTPYAFELPNGDSTIIDDTDWDMSGPGKLYLDLASLAGSNGITIVVDSLLA